MHRVDHSTAKAVRQAIEPAGTPGYFGDGNAGTGDVPTVLTADYMNAVQEELVSLVVSGGLVLDKSASNQLARAVAIVAGLQGAAVGANTLTLTPAFALPSYLSGHRIFAKIAANNTGAVTINVSSLGPKTIKTLDGAALKANDLRAGMVAELFFDGADYRLLNGQRGITAAVGDSSDTLATTNFVTLADAALLVVAKAYADAGDAATLAAATAVGGGRYAVAGGTANALTATISDPLAAYTPGVAIDVVAAFNNSGAATINVNSKGVKSIVNPDSSALLAGEITAGAVLHLVYNGTNFIYQNAPFGGQTPPAGANDKRFATMAALVTAISAAAAYRYLGATTATPMTAGTFYQVDTSAGAVTAPLPTAPTKGDTLTFVDVAKAWGANPFTLGRNGQTIMGLAEDLTCSKTNLQFSIWFNGSTWVLF